MTEDRGKLSREEEIAIGKQLRTYFAKHIPNNTFIGVFAEIEGNVASAAYLAISEKPANTMFITGITGTLLNVLTYPEYRRKGIAAKVINTIIDEAKKVGVAHIELWATSDGKFLYEKMGFYESNYTTMGLKLV
ncbi:MAG: GNAT family N-acetyltransferase [Defluviitaleaceae bacterium]|nr:GNAT family N-acetyltransferase [Defluviitaleaceae bacterium]